MKNLFKNILIFSNVVGLSISVFADSKYPVGLPNRVFGSNQDVGSCQSESYVTAVEHRLAEMGVPVRLSLQHTHPYVWSNNTNEEARNSGVGMTDTTRQLVSQFGGIVPDYFLPEDLEGVDLSSLSTEAWDKVEKTRLPIENLGIYIPQFSATDIGFSASYYTFSTGFGNTRSFEDMNNAVRSGEVIVLSFDSKFLYSFDPLTGLLRESYQKNDEYMTESNHSVAIVGYDDDLGGFIIRNTWNSPDALNEVDYYNVNHQANPEVNSNLDQTKIIDDLKHFRLKISQRVLPGYYLFPYQFVRDTAAKGIGGYRILSGNWGAFANQYVNLQNQFEVLKTFYTCNRSGLKGLAQRFKRFNTILNDPKESDERRQIAYRNVMSLVYGQIGKKKMSLNFAKQTRLINGSVDRSVDFYNGAFASYYCGAEFYNLSQANAKDRFWPLKGRDQILENPKYMQLVQTLSRSYADIDAWLQMFELLSQQRDL